MSSALCESVGITVRYDTKLSNGQTRRERASGFGSPIPSLNIPPLGENLWRWFFALRHTKTAYEDAISYPDLQAWSNLTGNLISPRDCDIIMRMDTAFRVAAAEVAKQDRELMERYKGAK